jgi:hypothetical protein
MTDCSRLVNWNFSLAWSVLSCCRRANSSNVMTSLAYWTPPRSGRPNPRNRIGFSGFPATRLISNCSQSFASVRTWRALMISPQSSVSAAGRTPWADFRLPPPCSAALICFRQLWGLTIHMEELHGSREDDDPWTHALISESVCGVYGGWWISHGWKGLSKSVQEQC